MYSLPLNEQLSWISPGNARECEWWEPKECRGPKEEKEKQRGTEKEQGPRKLKGKNAAEETAGPLTSSAHGAAQGGTILFPSLPPWQPLKAEDQRPSPGPQNRYNSAFLLSALFIRHCLWRPEYGHRKSSSNKDAASKRAAAGPLIQPSYGAAWGAITFVASPLGLTSSRRVQRPGLGSCHRNSIYQGQWQPRGGDYFFLVASLLAATESGVAQRPGPGSKFRGLATAIAYSRTNYTFPCPTPKGLHRGPTNILFVFFMSDL